MPGNFLEELVAEWLDYNGYLIKRNERVGRLRKGGYEGELDFVAFNPKTNHLIHIETSSDAGSWADREKRFTKKFESGKRYIKTLFESLAVPDQIEQKAIFGFGSNKNNKTIGGAQVVIAKDYVLEILRQLKDISSVEKSVPEKYPMLRLLQMVVWYWEYFVKELQKK